jgi:hypothetical protein
MAVNLAGMAPIIKHVFERVGFHFGVAPAVDSRAGDGPGLSVPCSMVDTLAQMFGNRTCDRVQFEH